jgi:transposase
MTLIPYAIMKNKYVKRSKISEAKFRKIIMYFSLELDSQKIAALTSLNRNTVNRYLGRVRARIVDLCELQARKRQSDLKTSSRVNGGEWNAPRQTGGEENLPVFGIRSRNDHVYTKLFPSGVHRKLRRLIREDPDQAKFTVPKEWHSYDGIVDLKGRWHYRLSPVSPGVQASEDIQRGIESFLGFARKRLTTFHLNGNDYFNLALKECEFRFNNRKEDLYQLLLKRFRERPLS